MPGIQRTRSLRDYPLPFGDNTGCMCKEGLTGEFRGPGPLMGYWPEQDVSHDENDTTLIY
jgi:hypothetical protein